MDGMKAYLKSSIVWILANVAGMGLYLLIEFWLLAPRPEGQELNGIDQKIYWLQTALPVLIIFLICNIIWLKSIFISRRSESSWSRFCIWMLMCVSWGFAIFGYSNIGVVMFKIFIGMVGGGP